MKLYIYTLISYLYISLSACFLYGWNSQHWLGNGDRVAVWNGAEPADYLRLGVLKDGVYLFSAGDIASAMGVSTNSALIALNSGELLLSCGTNEVAWTTDGVSLFFYGQKTDDLYAPENVYFLRLEPGALMNSHSAPPVSGGTNLWFMQSTTFRSEFLDVSAYFDRRSSNASITNAPIFGMSLGDSHCNRISCAFTADLPGYENSATTNINLRVHAISYGDYGAASDTHLFEAFVNGTSFGSYSWNNEQQISSEYSVPLVTVPDSQPEVRITNLTPSEHILLLDVDVEYPRLYEVGDEPLLCSGGSEGNIFVNGGSSNASVMVWDITDSLTPVILNASVVTNGSGWSSLFACGGDTNSYAVFEMESCFEPSVAGFADIDWNATGEIPELVIVTPPRRWVSGFEEALEPLVELRRRQRLTVRVVDAEDIYNAFSSGLVTPHAFQRFAAAGLSAGNLKPLRYLLFAGYASTDYQLETFIPDTIFKNGKKGFPALFPLLQVLQEEGAFYAMLLLPNDMMLGDADGNGVPDVAVGRFLATDASELSSMVAKTVTHDMVHPWNQVVIASDWNGTGFSYYDFSGYCDGLAGDYVGGGWYVTRYHCETEIGYNLIWKNTYYATGIWYDLHDGRDMFYYLGHSSDTLMGHAGSSGKYLLNIDRLTSADWTYAPFAMPMGCRMGRYTSLDVVNLSSCLMEVAVKNPSSAFSSLISSAGYLSFGDAREISDLFSDEINLYGAHRIGDAYVATLDQFGAAWLSRLQHMVLLGDPSMPVVRVKYGTVFKLQ